MACSMFGGVAYPASINKRTRKKCDLARASSEMLRIQGMIVSCRKKLFVVASNSMSDSCYGQVTNTSTPCNDRVVERVNILLPPH